MSRIMSAYKTPDAVVHPQVGSQSRRKTPSDLENLGLRSPGDCVEDNGQQNPNLHNPQTYARSKMGAELNFTVYRRCVHKVNNCRQCHVVPLLNKSGEVVNYFVDHRKANGKLITCTVGIGGIQTQTAAQLRQNAERRQALNKPESGETVNHQFSDAEEDENDVGCLYPQPSGFNFVDPMPKKIRTILRSRQHLTNKKKRKRGARLSDYRAESSPNGGRNTPEQGSSDKSDKSDQVPTEVTLDPELVKMHRNSHIDVEPTNAQHLESSLGSQLEQVKTQMSASFSTPVVKKATRCIEQLVLLVVGLQFDTTLEAMVSRCIQFVSAITDGGIVMSLRDILMKYISTIELPDALKGKTVKEAYETEQSSPSTIEAFTVDSLKIWETLKQGIFTKHLSYILGTVFAFSACKIKNINFSHPIYEKIMEHSSVQEIDGMDLIDHAIKLYNWTATTGLACLEQRSLDPIMINTSVLQKCQAKYYEWSRKFSDMKRTGVSTMEERQLMFVEVQEIQNTLEQFVKTQKEKYLTIQSSSLHKDVLSLYTEVREFVHKIDRVKVAMAFHIVGEPKTGKSTIVPLIQELICTARGVPYRPQDNAQINLLAPYQDELSNSTQTITINETVPIKDHLAKTIEVAYNTALALVDSVPLHPNRSSLEEKSKNTMQHVSVVSTGNAEEPFINAAKDPGAWSRRYPIIRMRVKAEFADAYGRFDSSKADGTNNYHWFDIYEIVYFKGERKLVYYNFKGKLSQNIDTYEAFELIRALAIKHFEEQDRLFEKHQSSLQKESCLECRRLSFMCKCEGKGSHSVIDPVDMKSVPGLIPGGSDQDDDDIYSQFCDKADMFDTKDEIIQGKGWNDENEWDAHRAAQREEARAIKAAKDKKAAEERAREEEHQRKVDKELSAYVGGLEDDKSEVTIDSKPQVQMRMRHQGKTECLVINKETGKAEWIRSEVEMGVSGTVVQSLVSLAWSSIVPWINPFIKAKWMWTLDSHLGKVFHEEIVEELSFWPDTIGCTALSMIPESWETRRDGSRTWLGRKKDKFVELLAAEKQIFLPLSYLFRRALCWGFLFGLFSLMLVGCLEYNGWRPRDYHEVVMIEKSSWEFGYKYFFPQWSEEVFKERDHYAQFGIYTENYVDWNQYYVKIYWFQRILGRLYLPWYFYVTRMIPVIKDLTRAWWVGPSQVTLFVTMMIFFYTWFKRWLGYNDRLKDLQERTRSDKNLQQSIMDRARRHTSEYNSYIPTAVGVIGAVVTGLVIWNTIRSSPEIEIERDSKTKSWNDYLGFTPRKVAEPVASRNSSSDEVAKIISKNLTRVQTKYNGETRYVHGIYIKPGVLLLPAHLFKVDVYKDDFVESLYLEMWTNGVYHNCQAYTKACVKIDGKDAFLLKVPKAPHIKQEISYLLPKQTGDGSIKSRLVYLKDKEVESEIFNATYQDEIDSGGFGCGRGLRYISTKTTLGFCGSVIMADRRDGAILGFHISGKNHTLTSRIGFSQEILHGAFERALKKLESSCSYITTPEAKELRTVRLGQNIIPLPGPHPKTQMFEEGAMAKYSCIEVLGHDPKMTTYKSRVRKGAMSDAITKHCGQPCRWKAPFLKEPWKHHNKALQHIAEGAREVPPDSLAWAVADYWNDLEEPLRKHMKDNPDLCRPLTLDEAINGHPDSLYMGRFKMDTSAGIPSGKKIDSGLFEELEPYEDGRKRYGLTKLAREYYDEMVEVFDKKEMFGIYVKTCLKDEVVEEDSEKVRIFYILECIFGLLCRQYYLPVAEFISRHPLTSECMVGVNCASTEWETFTKHILEHVSDGMLTDWDYSKYDLKRSCDVMCASLKLMVRITEFMGYPNLILNRMLGMAEELRSPIVNWNGTVIWTYFWCSGNSMTVYGNSIENSLHQRISFHWNGMRKLGPEKFFALGKFKDNEHVGTYGDDGVSGSKPEVREICDFFAKEEYFKMINMKITDAAKTGNPSSTVKAEDVDFLKRKSVFHEALGVRVGALDKESIWKMGHMTSGSGELEDLALAAIASMLTEAFLHGEEFHEWLREKLKLVADDCDIWTDILDRTYRDRVADWHEKYGSGVASTL